jgi:ATP-binding cassette subfamily F protein uup
MVPGHFFLKNRVFSMSLLQIKEISVHFGGQALLDNISLSIASGERISLVGRNGQGKSTLMKIMCKELFPDTGQVIWRQGLQVARLEQEVPDDIHGRVDEILHQTIQDHPEFKARDEQWNQRLAVEQLLSRMQLSGNDFFEHLSAGLKRRVLLAQCLILEPDVLFLDEPTNHLDIESIEWLESFLGGFTGTLFFVSHDRRFLQKLARKILELDRGDLSSWDCDFKTFQMRQQEQLDVEIKQTQKFKKELSKEEAWIREGIKARRTRNEGRVRRLKEMRDTYRKRSSPLDNVRIRAQDSKKTGNMIIEARDLSFAYDHNPVFETFSTRIMRGDRIGIIGPNGCGKTTLLRVLLGELPPLEGSLSYGTHLQIAYFDQLRSQLDPEKSVADNISPQGNEQIVFNGQTLHVIPYLQNFLFSREQAVSPIKSLSGGERNRLLIAKMFTQPANVLVLDEPTNDLDAETIELLEEVLLDFSGTILLVSHDREFLNNVATHTFVFQKDKRIEEHAGGYDDWLRVAQSRQKPEPQKTVAKKIRPRRAKKLSWKEQKELDALFDKISFLENEKQNLVQHLSDPQNYQQKGVEIADLGTRLESVENDLAQAYDRWVELESKLEDE